jgi:hypothetical protein
MSNQLPAWRNERRFELFASSSPGAHPLTKFRLFTNGYSAGQALRGFGTASWRGRTSPYNPLRGEATVSKMLLETKFGDFHKLDELCFQVAHVRKA